MNRVRIADVRLGDRHRQDFGDIDGLVRSIEGIGLLQPIVVTPDMELIAGTRRLEAYKRMKRTEIPAHIVPLQDILRGELEENTCRKDFTPSEMVAVTRAIRSEEQKSAKERMTAAHASPGNFPEQSKGRVRDKVGAYVGVSGRTLERMEAVVDAAEAEPEKYGKLLADMERTGKINGVHRQLITARKAEIIQRESPPLPAGPFRVIVVDPPWEYHVRPNDPSHRAVAPYPLMSIEAICALPVSELAHDNAVLWLWTTNAHLRLAFGVLDAWSFEHKTTLTWFKNKMGTGNWLRGKTEHCLLAVRGKPVVTLGGQTTALIAPARGHSKKPDEFYTLVESLCPAPPGGRVELFQRTPRAGWVGHGDEVRDGQSARGGTAA